jgi:predicted alpha/beta-hydrolase family hydrolase
VKRPRWLPGPYRRYAPPDPAPGSEPEPEEPPREFTAAERALQRRARLQVLLIGGVALGGIVCMMVVTALILWNLSR